MDLKKDSINCLKCHHRHPQNGNCTAVGGFCTAVPAARCPLIPELEARAENAEQERDAAVNYMRRLFGWCTGCVHFTGTYSMSCKIGKMSDCTDSYEFYSGEE